MRPSLTTSDARPRLADFLSAHRHAFTRAQLTGTWTRELLDSALRSGAAIRILPGVYCSAAYARDPQVIGEAINLWAPRALVTGALALHLCDPSLPAPARPELLTRHGARLRPPPWLGVRQVAAMPASAVCSGVRCVRPARAVIDSWRTARPEARTDLVYSALWARVCSWQEVERELSGTARLPDRRKLERLLAWFAQGATSPLEVRARRDVFRSARFREFEWQVRLPLRGRVAYVDMLHRRARVAVELDGDLYHSTRDQRDDDRSRQADLAAAGFVVIRLGWNDITERPQWCRDRVLRAVAAQVRRPWST